MLVCWYVGTSKSFRTSLSVGYWQVLDCWELVALYTIPWLSDLHYGWSHPQCVSSYWAVNVSTRLSVYTKEEQRRFIRFLWAEGFKGAENHARLCTQYGDNALQRRSVNEWIEMFKNCRPFAADDEVNESVHDWLRSQPQTFFSNNIKKLTDRWAKCIEIKGDFIEK